MQHRLLVLLPLALAALFTEVQAQHAWVQNPANGHWYSRTAVVETWQEAQAEATALGGCLVVLDDAAENDWVHQTFVASGIAMAAYGPWIGYYQDTLSAEYSEPGGGWTWVHSNPTYTNWASGEPNDGLGGAGEDWAHYRYSFSPVWNDIPLNPSGGLYGIIELDTGPALVLHVDNLVAGSQATLSVAGATTGDLIGFGYSLLGPGPMPIPILPGMILELTPPFFVMGAELADATGVASVTSPLIPPGIAGLTVWFDAVVLASPYSSSAGVAQMIQ